jgi:hypothetical protein
MFQVLFSPQQLTATILLAADDYASVSVNGRVVSPTSTWPYAATIPGVQLRAGNNLVMLHARTLGGAAMAAMTMFGPDGKQVLLHTDWSWAWIEAPTVA